MTVEYLIEPVDGRPSFVHRKRQTLGPVDLRPQPGLAWPAWFDPEDPSTVAIGSRSSAAGPAPAMLAALGLTSADLCG